MNFIKFVRIFLLILIVIGIGLLLTQKFWVPKVVDRILGMEKSEPKNSDASIYTGVMVKAKKEQVGSNYRFTYRVINNSDLSVTGINIGIDNEGNQKIDFGPVGSNYIMGQLAPESSYTSPVGWKFDVMAETESASYAIIWSNAEIKYQIKKDKELSGFSVLVPEDDENYLSTFMVIFDNGANATGSIVLDN